MLRLEKKLPLFENDDDAKSIVSFDLKDINKGMIYYVTQKMSAKPKAEKLNIHIHFPDDKADHFPVKQLLALLSEVKILDKSNLTDKERNSYHACMKRFIAACASNQMDEKLAAANGLLAHVITLHKKYNSRTTKKKKSKKVLVVYMNNPERWDNNERLDLPMYCLSKVVAEKKRSVGHDVMLVNLTDHGDIPALLNELAVKKKKFSDVCLVGHSLRYNYDHYDPPYKSEPTLQDVACHHIGGFAIEDCADLIYQLAAKHGVNTVKSFACESGVLAFNEAKHDGTKYDDQGEVPPDIDLLSEAPSIMQLTLAHVALLAQMDKHPGKLNLLAISPNGIGLIDSNNDFKFSIMHPRDYFENEFKVRADIIPRSKSRISLFPAGDIAEMQRRSEEARAKLEHKLQVLKDRLHDAKDGDIVRLLKREIHILDEQLNTRKSPTKSPQAK